MSELFAKALTSHLLELLAVVSAFVEFRRCTNQRSNNT